MTFVRITKIFRFETSHRLHNYDGPCRNIHGHSYELHVTVGGKPEADKDSPKVGMVLDFSVLKKIVAGKVIRPFDHALLLSEREP